ncbi:acyltransferase [Ruminococcus sp. AF13-28]|jgi:peptidoglycan/LPS O-acetylase OafA/YrhL|nr:acyltransferase [Ruminococcus sp. AF13-37]RGW20812.1 acyltransferase [Ruminococcus sp. AF13-28]
MVRNKQIDGLRGVTIILIVLFHLFCRYREIYCGYTIWYLKWIGNFGNSIFLLISSYFLIGILGKKINVIKFWTKKIFRLWPCYIVSITLTMIFTHLFELPQRTCSWKEYLLNTCFINGFIGCNYVDGAHWYITTLIGAIIIVGLIKYFQIDKYVCTYLLWIFLEGFSGVIGFVPLNQILGSSYVSVICIGIALSIMQQKQYKIRCLFKFTKLEKYIYKNQWLFLSVICLIYYLLRRGILAICCLCLAIPVFLIVLYKKGKIFEYKIVQFFGRISYPLYLIHQNIAYLIEFNLAKKYNQVPLNLIGGVAFFLVLLAGTVLYYLVEKPAQNWIQNYKFLE